MNKIEKLYKICNLFSFYNNYILKEKNLKKSKKIKNNETILKFLESYICTNIKTKRRKIYGAK